jgi:hypothetical protein
MEIVIAALIVFGAGMLTGWLLRAFIVPYTQTVFRDVPAEPSEQPETESPPFATENPEDTPEAFAV